MSGTPRKPYPSGMSSSKLDESRHVKIHLTSNFVHLVLNICERIPLPSPAGSLANPQAKPTGSEGGGQANGLAFVFLAADFRACSSVPCASTYARTVSSVAPPTLPTKYARLQNNGFR